MDESAVRAFQRHVSHRRNCAGKVVAASTVQKYWLLLVYLYRSREEIGDGLTFDPCAGRSASKLAGVHEHGRGRLPYTPDAVAVPLVQGAIDFLTDNALTLLSARERYAHVIQEQRRRGFSDGWADIEAARALKSISIGLGCRRRSIDSLTCFYQLVEGLYSACFIVLSYLVGARASEILHWRVDCVHPVTDSTGSATLSIIRGTIFKGEADGFGRPHEWVVPPPAVHAITVLEALSSPHRAKHYRTPLWLRAQGRPSRAREWDPGRNHIYKIVQTATVRSALNRFAALIGGFPFEGKPWHLSTHQGRKTFARFVALRDRSGLFALAEHLGHRERAVTDYSYSGPDYRLNEEIHAEILEQSVSAWEHMLVTPKLGGRAGEEILARRPRFRGHRLRQDLKGYARTLVDAGLVLGVCDWGFCVYRQEHSACLGNAAGPNPHRREPSTCARCKNFVLSAEHRPYWNEQVRRHRALLNEPALPTQTLKIARSRLDEAQAILKSMKATVPTRRTYA